MRCLDRTFAAGADAADIDGGVNSRTTLDADPVAVVPTGRTAGKLRVDGGVGYGSTVATQLARASAGSAGMAEFCCALRRLSADGKIVLLRCRMRRAATAAVRAGADAGERGDTSFTTEHADVPTGCAAGCVRSTRLRDGDAANCWRDTPPTELRRTPPAGAPAAVVKSSLSVLNDCISSSVSA